MAINKIMLVPIGQLIHADWNYKLDGTREEIEKLKNSITEDKSAGVIAVREIDIEEDGTIVYEVIDGNHRLTAIQELGWKKVPVENFGDISQAKAVIVGTRRNTAWFADDKDQLKELFKEIVLPEIPIASLENFMPDTTMDLIKIAGGIKEEKEERDKSKTKDSGSDVLKNRFHLSIRLDEQTEIKFSNAAKREDFTNLEEFALHCIRDYLKRMPVIKKKAKKVRRRA